MRKNMIMAFLFGVVFTTLVGGFFTFSEAKADHTPVVSPQEYAVYFNGELTPLAESLNVDGKTYIQLREFCAKTKMEVIWNDPKLQRMPLPYGRYHDGITILNPTIISSKEMKHSFTGEEGEYINITGLVERYSDKNQKLPYSFSDIDGRCIFLIEENGIETQISLKTFPSYQQVYIGIDDFKTDILPYWVDMCLANEAVL